MGFTKLDSGIIDSSIWAEPIATRVVWVTFLAKANRNGFVAASHSGMQRASNVPLDEFDAAITCLESPDNDSRSREHDGRRIEKVQGGWQILNYRKYREFSYSDGKAAVIKRAQRAKKKGQKVDIGGHVHFSSGHSASASASASVDKILEYFNAVTGQKRSAKCEETRKLVAGRIADGRTIDDFKLVISRKFAQWKDDPKMAKFIRPSTLFRAGNFEDYLNEREPVGVRSQASGSAPVDSVSREEMNEAHRQSWERRKARGEM